MTKCPYCFEELREKAFTALTLDNHALKCPHCNQFIITDLVKVDYPSLDQKRCIFCGNKILLEAKICRFCHKWLDELDQSIEDTS